MADSISLMFQAGVQFDVAQVQAAVNRVTQSVSKAPPIQIQSAIGNRADPINADALANSVNITAQSIKNINLVYGDFVDNAGNMTRQLIRETVDYTDVLGNTEKYINRMATAGNQVGANITTNIPVGSQIAKLEKDFKAQLDLQDKMAKKATDWSNRAESMGNKEKLAIQGVGTALQANIQAYARLNPLTQSATASALATTIKGQNIELDRQISLSKRSATGLRSWADSIKNAIMQTVSYSMSLGLVRGAQQLLNEALRFTIDLNKEMTKIQVLQVEGAQTPEEIRALAKEFNNLGKEMGATTMEIASGSVEWLRQGKTISETTQLLKASTMLSKLGALDAAQATDYLTSTLNSYKLGSEDAIAVVDKLINKTVRTHGDMWTISILI